ncbi:MAG: LysM peptidoglycan-binding domain-containing protein [Anaerolineae bacterium]|nr:LysM peptidoglycan-binding domain-containing protein [Anaerolineae bacterium]
MNAHRLTRSRVPTVIAVMVMMLLATLVAPLPAHANAPQVGTPIGVVTNASFLNVRAGPSVFAPIIGVISRGQSFVLVGRSFDSSWLQIRFSGYAVGWVRSFYMWTNVSVFALPITDGTQPVRRVYVVQRGDNLFRISLRFGVSMQALAAANGITNYNYVYVGQVLVIP